jgi:hypothetical protein
MDLTIEQSNKLSLFLPRDKKAINIPDDFPGPVIERIQPIL